MALEDVTKVIWGNHPMDWPTPPRKIPRWWEFKAKRTIAELNRVFGPLNQESLDKYWREVRKGQSIYEDAGGYMERCYKAMASIPVDEPYTYDAAVSDLMSGNRSAL